MEVLSAEHVGALAVTAVAVGWAARTRSVAASRGLAAVIGTTYVVEHAAFVVRGTWSLEFNLPLHLTDAVTIVSVLALWTGRPGLVELTYFWALSASLQAVLTPDLGSEFPEIFYWTYFITHSGAVVAAILLVAGRRIVPRRGPVKRVFVLTLAFAAGAGLANVLTGGNYMFLREKPDSATLLDVMGPWPWYVLTGAVLALLLFSLLDLPLARRRRTADPSR